MNLARDLEYVFAQLKLYGAKGEIDRQLEKRKVRTPARETRQRRRHRANVDRMAYGSGNHL